MAVAVLVALCQYLHLVGTSEVVSGGKINLGRYYDVNTGNKVVYETVIPVCEIDKGGREAEGQVVELLARELGVEINEITKFGGNSRILYDRTK